MLSYTWCPKCQSELKLDEKAIPDLAHYQHCSNADCNFVHYQNPTPVVAAVVEYGNGEIVLAHNASWPWKFFGLITGFLERHEHPDECVVREVKEEIGLDATIVSLIGHYTFKKLNQLIIAYHVKATGTIVLEDEIDEVRVIPFEKIKTWPSGTGVALGDFLRSKGFDPIEIEFPKA